jgi:hypothetical protein
MRGCRGCPKYAPLSSTNENATAEPPKLASSANFAV